MSQSSQLHSILLKPCFTSLLTHYLQKSSACVQEVRCHSCIQRRTSRSSQHKHSVNNTFMSWYENFQSSTEVTTYISINRLSWKLQQNELQKKHDQNFILKSLAPFELLLSRRMQSNLMNMVYWTLYQSEKATSAWRPKNAPPVKQSIPNAQSHNMSKDSTPKATRCGMHPTNDRTGTACTWRRN